MSRDLNKIMIIGRLGKDPEIRYTSSGRPVANFSVATNRNWTATDGERRTETEWFNIVAWGNLAEICNEILNKGDRVYIDGRLQTRKWQDANEVWKSRVELIANEVISLTERSKNFPDHVEAGEIEGSSGLEDFPGDEEEDDFPF